jgi:hypothetical protein
MRSYLIRGFALISQSGLAACGGTVPEQALFGAGAGMGTAAVLDGDMATGAVVGAAGNIAYCQAYPDRCN